MLTSTIAAFVQLGTDSEVGPQAIVDLKEVLITTLSGQQSRGLPAQAGHLHSRPQVVFITQIRTQCPCRSKPGDDTHTH